MNSSLIPLVLVVIALSCVGKKGGQPDRATDGHQEETIKKKLPTRYFATTPLLENRVERVFSKIGVKDTFMIAIVGKSILEGQLIFTIINHQGQVLFREQYPSTYLIGYGLPETASTIERENFIKQRVFTFFNRDNFLAPAIAVDETFNEEFSDEDSWKAIRSDSTAVGFRYAIAEENNCNIAYSKKQRKVVTYFCCC